MTRRRDLMCEDIFGCDHTASVPVSEGNELVAWMCSCGAVKHPVKKPEPAETKGTDR